MPLVQNRKVKNKNYCRKCCLLDELAVTIQQVKQFICIDCLRGSEHDHFKQFAHALEERKQMRTLEHVDLVERRVIKKKKRHFPVAKIP